MGPPGPIDYDLAALFVDQPEWFAHDTIPHLLAWLGDPSPPVVFKLEAPGVPARLTLRWSRPALRARMPSLDDEVRRLARGESPQVEQVPQYGAYALAGVIASAVLRRRAVAFSRWGPPDILFDATPGALRGVEVAGRSGGGLATLRALARTKTEDARGRPDVAEAWLSLWCKLPRMSLLLRAHP